MQPPHDHEHFNHLLGKKKRGGRETLPTMPLWTPCTAPDVRVGRGVSPRGAEVDEPGEWEMDERLGERNG